METKNYVSENRCLWLLTLNNMDDFICFGLQPPSARHDAESAAFQKKEYKFHDETNSNEAHNVSSHELHLVRTAEIEHIEITSACSISPYSARSLLEPRKTDEMVLFGTFMMLEQDQTSSVTNSSVLCFKLDRLIDRG